jgi:hypothetical protein
MPNFMMPLAAEPLVRCALAIVGAGYGLDQIQGRENVDAGIGMAGPSAFSRFASAAQRAAGLT